MAKAATTTVNRSHRRRTAAESPRTKKQSVETFTASELEVFRRELLAMRDRLTGKVTQMRSESLTRDDEVNPEEDGTDAFERLFSLERASSDQDMIFNIDEALRALDEGTYGRCEQCGCNIERARLQALPFAKNCIKCQSELERSRGGYVSPRRMSM